jgi:cation transport ATPase
VDGSFDEEAFLSEAGIGSGDGFADGGGAGGAGAKKLANAARDANKVEKALTAFYRATGLGRLSDFLRGNAAACGVAWCFLIIAGIAHGLTHVSALAESFAGMAANARAAETFATALVYLVSGPSEFVDVSYELAVGNVNIHVLTTLAVAGTVLLGCALEGALLLVLFSTAAFVEMRLTGHARGDLKSLWATVPGEAVLVEVDKTGAPVAATEQVIPARDVSVGAHVFVRSGQQVRRFLPLFFSSRVDGFAPSRQKARSVPSRAEKKKNACLRRR